MSDFFGGDELSSEELRRILRSLPRAGAPDDFESKLLDRVAEIRREHIASHHIAVIHDGSRGRRLAGLASALGAALVVAFGAFELSPGHHVASDTARSVSTFLAAHTLTLPSPPVTVDAPDRIAAMPPTTAGEATSPS